MSTSAANLEVKASVAPKAVVTLFHVADVQRSIDFYQKLGFELGNEPLKNEQGTKTFAWMHHGSAAQIMLTLTGRPLNPGVQDVMFYLYVTDMPAYREQIISRGVAVAEVKYPFWSPNGEFRVDDPDGWTWMVC
jgi:catechol 2,3-dioxygenase-like lactoylglutathione lyase family enzyme